MTDKIRFYNTKTRKTEEFVPLRDKEAGIYSCGPTVYHYQHIGNMRAAVFADTLHRTLAFAGYEVKHVINITDVGHLTSDGDEGVDKMEKGAQREGKSVYEVAKMFTDAYFRDISALGIRIDEYLFPRATDHIREQVELVTALEGKGYTYRTSDGIYFDTAKFPRYADFAHLDVSGLKSGARVEENTEKRSITDFALWKFSPTDEKRQMEWDSPWGKGFPGWHIECSAMAMKYLGNPFDIHTGGIEHIPVHHTNEIAQSECATGTPFAVYWMHNNHLLDSAGKMSKSNGEFLTLSALEEKGYSPSVFRYFLMSANYRKELLFSFEALDAAKAAYEKLAQFCRDNAGKGGSVSEEYRERFKEAVFDDLNTPKAAAVVWTMLKDDLLPPEDAYMTLMEFDKVLGLGLEDIKKEEIILSDEMLALLEAREQARKEKNFAEADRLREEMEKQGFIVKDTKDGQSLSK
jgi:cysteinyl-tRNA synthetase